MKKGFGDSDYQGTEYVLNGKSKTKTGSVHPEIGKLRLKYCMKDMKLFTKYGVVQFFRDPYKSELDLYPDEAFGHLKGGKNACEVICCVKVGAETRAVLPMTKEDVIKQIKESKQPLGLVKDKSLNRDAY